MKESLGILSVFLLLVIVACSTGGLTRSTKSSRTEVDRDPSSEPPVRLKSVVFQNIISNTSAGGATTLLTQVRPSFVLRAFFKYFPPKDMPTWNAQISKLQSESNVIKQNLPGVILQGGITVSYLNKSPRDTWADGTSISDSDFQAMLLKDSSGNPVVFPEGNAGYLADLNSPLFQSFLIGWCKPQIDAGMTSLFFDEPFMAARYRVNQWKQNPATVYPQAATAFKAVADALRSYAASKGQQLLIGKNDMRLDAYTGFFQQYPELLAGDDLIMGTFEDGDFQANSDGSFTVVENFPSVVQQYNSIMGHPVPIIAFIDWSHALSEFASLSTSNQATVLQNLDAATKAAGVSFAYPVYGGSVVSAQSSSTYDSTRVGTFSTILNLVNIPQ